MSHWMCDDKSPVQPLRDLRPMCDGRPPEPKGDHSLCAFQNCYRQLDLTYFSRKPVVWGSHEEASSIEIVSYSSLLTLTLFEAP